MAKWSGNARTNFVRINDMESLEKSIKPFGVELYQHEYNPEYFCLCPKQIDGCGSFSPIHDEESGQEIPFAFETFVMPYIKEGEVLIVQNAGAEGLSYVLGESKAFCREGRDIKSVAIDIDDIYKLAAEKFEMDAKDIARCDYNYLPENIAGSVD